MSMTEIKHGGSWDVMAKVFQINSLSFERRITGFVTMLAPCFESAFVDSVADMHTYTDLRLGKK